MPSYLVPGAGWIVLPDLDDEREPETSLTLDQITALNAAIAAGTIAAPPSGTRIRLSSTGADNGTAYSIKGVGTAAAFSVDGGGSPILVTGTPGGLLTASFPMGVGAVRWQNSADGVTWTDVAAATNLTFDSSGQAGKKVRAIATSYTPAGSPVSVPAAEVTVTSGPVITVPLIVGAAAAFTPAVFSDASTPSNTQFSVAGVDAGATYTPTLADSAKTIRVRQASASGSPVATSVPALVGWQNWKSSNTVAIRAMMASGVGRMLFNGDSYLAGNWSNGSSYGNQVGSAIAAQLADLLTAAGKSASDDSVIGTGRKQSSGQTATTINESKPRLVFSGTGLMTLNNFEAMGGQMLRVLLTGNKYTYTPKAAFNEAEILFAMVTAGSGSYTVSVDGGTTPLATITDLGASNSVQRVIVPVPPGSTALTIKGGVGAAGNCQVAVITRNNLARGLELYNAGQSGAQVAAMAAAATTTADINTWNVRATLPVLLSGDLPNVTFINGWYNDRTAGRSLAQIQADLTTLINAAKAQGDVVYMNYAGLDTATISDANFRTFSDGCIATALGLDIPVHDASRLVNYAANPTLFGDPLHLNAAGHGYQAASIAARLFAPLT